MKPRILITDRIHESAIKEAKKFADVDIDFECSHENLVKKINKYDALVVRSATKVTREVIEAGNLKIIGRAGVGLDNIDIDAAGRKGIKVVNSQEAPTIAVAELVFGEIIALMRNIIPADKTMRENRWEKNLFTGNELYGKTIGIIGFGRIGKEIAIRARAFGMKIIVYDPHITNEDAREFNAERVELNALSKNSDIITLHLPLTEETRNLVNKDRLKLMKKSAILVNAARGGIIDEKALYSALKERGIRGAALDVFENEPPVNSRLLTLDNVVLTPHIGASTEEAQINAGMIVVEKIRNSLFLSKRKILAKKKGIRLSANSIE